MKKLSLYRNEKTVIYLFLSVLFLFSGIDISAQTEKKAELLTKETFMQKVWNYKESPNELKYLGEKPCIIDFYSDNCRPCRKIAPYMEELSKAFDGQIYVYKINTDHERELFNLFQLNSEPLVVFIPMTGKPTCKIGAYTKEAYEMFIKEILLR